MRSGAELLLAAVLAFGPLAGLAQEADAPARGGEAPPRSEIREALAEVASDPNLSAERSINMLRWKKADPVTDDPWWWAWANGLARWLRGLFGWIAESGRVVVWVLGALAAAGLALYVARLVRTRGLLRAPAKLAAPSHVRDLDIRPESLPGDVGGAAAELWERGEQRAALALLYRGLLSQLVHVHGVPIRASSTEGECLALAEPRLSATTARYASRLVATWAGAVYGGRGPEPGTVQALAREFGPALAPRSDA